MTICTADVLTIVVKLLLLFFLQSSAGGLMMGNMMVFGSEIAFIAIDTDAKGSREEIHVRFQTFRRCLQDPLGQ